MKKLHIVAIVALLAIVAGVMIYTKNNSSELFIIREPVPPAPIAATWQVERTFPTDAPNSITAIAFPMTADGPLAIAAADRVAVLAYGTVVPMGGEPMTFPEPPKCLAFSEDGKTLAVGFRNSVRIFVDADHDKTVSLGKRANICGIAIRNGALYVTDFSDRRLVKFDIETGEMVGEFRDKNGFRIPSPNFAVASSHEGIWVVNPGRQRLVLLSDDLNILRSFERTVSETEDPFFDFFGCCNPSYIATLPDGHIVTSEKGVAPRIKVYKPDGKFDSLVLTLPGTNTRNGATPWPIATDNKGRIHVVNGTSIHIFMPVE